MNQLIATSLGSYLTVILQIVNLLYVLFETDKTLGNQVFLFSLYSL